MRMTSPLTGGEISRIYTIKAELYSTDTTHNDSTFILSLVQYNVNNTTEKIETDLCIFGPLLLKYS